MTSPTAAAGNGEQDTIGKVLGRIPSGVFILTARDNAGQETGMLASWVQQASFAPPAVTVAVNAKRYLNDWLTAGSSVVLNVVGESNKGLLGHFGRGFDPGQPAFEGIEISRSANDIPVIASALGHLEGRITGSLDAGDHILYVVEVVSAGVGASIDAEQPMVHIRKNGFNY